MLNSPLLRSEDLIFKDAGVRDITRHVLLPLWNAYSFLSTYADADKWLPKDEYLLDWSPSSQHEMDRWIISRLQTLSSSVSEQMQNYRLYLVVSKVIDFIEDLTNWYIRLSRRRFWGRA